MKIIVTDSSVIVKWVNKDDESNLENADKLLHDVQTGKAALLAPELAKYEVGNALIKKGLTTAQAFQSLGTVYSLPIRFIPENEDLALLTYEMAAKVQEIGDSKFTYYDAAFTALAKREQAILVTDNPKHQKKISGVKVVSLGDY